ncbi:AMP-binding protein [Blastococcus sp. SYSU DS0973]
MKATRTHEYGRALPDWPRETIAARFVDACGRSPDRVVIVEGDTRLTNRELLGRAAALASGLESLGVGPGDVVTLLLPDWWESVVAFYAAQLRGAVVNPIVPIYRESELAFIYGQARPAVVISPETYRNTDYLALNRTALEMAGLDAPVVTVRGSVPSRSRQQTLEKLWQTPDDPIVPAGEADDVAMLMYTSGTTSIAKGVLHSHASLLYEARSFFDLFGLDADDVIFMPSPVTHIAGLVFGMMAPVVFGQRVVLLDRWAPHRARELIEREGCTWCLGATPFLKGLLDAYAAEGRQCHLRFFACGGADVSPRLVVDAERLLGTKVMRVYGSTEYPTFSCSGPEAPLERRAETDGAPIGEAECLLLDVVEGVGELAVRGPEMFLGYLDDSLNAAAFTEDGYFRTGDLASFEDGYVTIRGRQKDIIVRGGENISAREVEDHLYAHPAVTEVAVVGLPDPVMGERACAFVVPAPGHEDLELADLVEFLAQRGIARQKFPEQLRMLDGLPKTASGKIQKHMLRSRQ